MRVFNESVQCQKVPFRGHNAFGSHFQPLMDQVEGHSSEEQKVGVEARMHKRLGYKCLWLDQATSMDRPWEVHLFELFAIDSNISLPPVVLSQFARKLHSLVLTRDLGILPRYEKGERSFVL